ncbi:hypothetical protein AB0A81_26900 [Streptomyces flaveolus]|uniref:Phosphotriesterase-related protein n=1 Tax=Streptomyces flaveolus TaxID=67297 RepID=A0ABV1VG91_9ACTN
MAQPDGIPTVLGEIGADQLGGILPHEHVVTASAGMWDVYPEIFGDHRALDARAITALRQLRTTEFRTIVDLTPHDLGRDVPLLKRVSARSGVNIIIATGCWLDPPRALAARTPKEVAALFIRELTQGIAGTDARAAVIKVASEGEITDAARTILQASAIASRDTGAPVYTHSASATRDGLRQLDVLVAAGADARRVCIGHSNDTSDLAYLTELAQRGAYIGLDRFPGYVGAGLDERIDFVTTLIDNGLIDRLLLSHDWAVEYSHGQPPRDGAAVNDHGYRLIADVVLPRLRSAGATEATIRTLTHDNPRRFLTGACA